MRTERVRAWELGVDVVDRVEGFREGEEPGEVPESADVTRLTPFEGGFLAAVDIALACGKGGDGVEG